MSKIGYGEHTNVTITDTEAITLSGQLYELLISGSKVTVNGPVLSMNEYGNKPYSLRIGSRIENLQFRNQPDSRITLLNGAYIRYGFWGRGLRGTAYFDSVSGPLDLYSEGQLHVMSYKNGQTIAAILPSDSTVTGAAGQIASVFAETQGRTVP